MKCLEMNSKIKIPIQDFIDYEKDLLEEEEIMIEELDEGDYIVGKTGNTATCVMMTRD